MSEEPTDKIRILLVDDDPGVRRLLARALAGPDRDIARAEHGDAAMAHVGRERPPDIIITDVRMPGLSGLELLERLEPRLPGTDIILVTAFAEMDTAVRAMQAGAYDFLVKPLEIQRVQRVVDRCLRDRAARGSRPATVRPFDPDAAPAIIGRSAAMIETYKLIGRVADSRAPVLIRGETGTGKELVARAIHRHAANAAEPFIATNCPALTEDLLESELFGHITGAFTGAVRDRKGRFEMAGCGTIFLDEIGDAPPAFQGKLLRVLQEREFYPVGGEKPRRADARVIAASHRDLETMVEHGTFREDLYFRLRGVEVTIPPLRERREDIPLLAHHFLKMASERLGQGTVRIPDPVMRRLKAYPWPGNVRELEHVIGRAAVVSNGPAISVDHLSFAAPGAEATAPAGRTLADVERAHVQRMLHENGGNKRRTARVLDISRSRLDRIIKKYGLTVPK